MKAVIWPIIMVIVVVGFINVISPKGTVNPEEQYLERSYPNAADEQKWRKKVDEDFTNPDNTFEYVKLHYELNRENLDNDFEIINYYQDRTLADDQQYRDIGYLGLAFCNYYLKKYAEASDVLSKCSNEKLKYRNYLLGLLSQESNYTGKAEAFFRAEVANYGKDNFAALWTLSKLYEMQNDYNNIYKLVKKYKIEEYFSTEVVRKAYIVNSDVVAYIYNELTVMYSYFSVWIFLSALCISGVWLYYIYKLDIFEKENVVFMVITFLYACVCCFFAFPLYDFYDIYFNFGLSGNVWNDFMYSVFGIGVIEELVKLLPLIIILLFTKQINEPYDYILYACVSALGFAFIENIMYLNRHSMSIVETRAFYAAIGHMCDSAFFAYGLVLAKYRYKGFGSVVSIVLGYAAACLSHGLYDFAAFSGSTISFIVIFYIEIALFTLVINNCLNNSSFFTYQNKPQDHKLEFILAVSLTGIFLLQYVVNAFQYGIESANGSLFVSFISGWFIIPYFVYKLSRLDMVKGYWFGYYNKTKNKYEVESPGSQVISMFFGDSIEPHNYVGATISFRPEIQNTRLYSYIPGSVDGVITHRLVVPVRAKDSAQLYEDPYFFLLKLKSPLSLPEGNFTEVVLRFKYNCPDPYVYPNVMAYIYLMTSPTNESTVRDLKFYPGLIYKGTILLNVVPEAIVA